VQRPLLLRENGNRVVVSGRHEDVGQALAAELREFGAKRSSSAPTCAAMTNVRSLVDQTSALRSPGCGGHSAGTEGKPGPVTEQTSDSYAATFDTNVSARC